MMILSGVIMVAALIGMIICSKKQKTNPGAQPIAIALLIVVIVSGIYMLYKNNIFGNSNTVLVKAETHYYASQGYMIGKFIAKNIPGAKVLLVADEGFENNKRETAFSDALKKGMGNDNVKRVGLVLLNKPKGDVPMIIPPQMTSKDFDAVLKNSSENVIVSTIGLPQDAIKMNLWKISAAKRPKLILAGADPRGSIKLTSAIKKDMISAIVVVSSNAKFDEKGAPSSFEDAFKKRYILINKDNIAENEKLLK